MAVFVAPARSAPSFDGGHAARHAAEVAEVAAERLRVAPAQSRIVESGPDLRAGAGKLSLLVALAALFVAVVGAVSMATGEDFGLNLPTLDPSAIRLELPSPPERSAESAAVRGSLSPDAPPADQSPKPPETAPAESSSAESAKASP